MSLVTFSLKISAEALSRTVSQHDAERGPFHVGMMHFPLCVLFLFFVLFFLSYRRK